MVVLKVQTIMSHGAIDDKIDFHFSISPYTLKAIMTLVEILDESYD